MSENWKIQVSPKLPDGTLVNLRAESADEMDRLLRFVEQRAQDITTTAALLTGAGVAASAGLTQPSSPVPPSVPAPPADSAPVCRHGQKTWKPAGVSRAGRAYNGFWACNGPRDDQCKSWDN